MIEPDRDALIGIIVRALSADPTGYDHLHSDDAGELAVAALDVLDALDAAGLCVHLKSAAATMPAGNVPLPFEPLWLDAEVRD